MTTDCNTLSFDDLYDVARKHRVDEVKENEPIYITNPEFCDIFSCSRTTAFRLRKSGKLPFQHIGNQVIYEYEALMLAIRTSKIVIKWMPKREAIERLTNYRKLIEL